MKPLLVTTNEATVLLGCSYGQLMKLLNSNAIESVYDGRLRKVKYASIEKYVANLSRFPRKAAS